MATSSSFFNYPWSDDNYTYGNPTAILKTVTIKPEDAATNYAKQMMVYRKRLHKRNIELRVMKFIETYMPNKKCRRSRYSRYSSEPFMPQLPTPDSLKQNITIYDWNLYAMDNISSSNANTRIAINVC